MKTRLMMNTIILPSVYRMPPKKANPIISSPPDMTKTQDPQQQDPKPKKEISAIPTVKPLDVRILKLAD